MLNRRWLRTAVGIVMAHDEFLADRRDFSRIPDLVRRDSLKENPVFQRGDLRRVLLRSVPEPQNGGETLHRTQDRPVPLAGFGELTVDDVVRLLGIRRLRDCASPALKLTDHGGGKLGERRGREPHDPVFRFVKLVLNVGGQLGESCRNCREEKKGSGGTASHPVRHDSTLGPADWTPGNTIGSRLGLPIRPVPGKGVARKMAIAGIAAVECSSDELLGLMPAVTSDIGRRRGRSRCQVSVQIDREVNRVFWYAAVYDWAMQLTMRPTPGMAACLHTEAPAPIVTTTLPPSIRSSFGRRRSRR